MLDFFLVCQQQLYFASKFFLVCANAFEEFRAAVFIELNFRGKFFV